MKATRCSTGLLLGCFVLAGCAGTAAKRTSATQVATGPARTQVVILGALHTDGFRDKTIYTPERVRDLLVAVKPNIILHEVPPKYCWSSGRPLAAFKTLGTDGWIIMQAADRLGIPLKPCDRPDRDEYREKTNYWSRYVRAERYIQAWMARMEKDESTSVEKGFYELLRAVEGPGGLPDDVTAEFINGREYDQGIRAEFKIKYEILPNYVFCHHSDGQQAVADLRFMDQEWKDRNGITVQNILKWARKYPGGRVAVVIGAAHRYILRDLLKKEPDIALKEYYEILEPGK